MAGNEDMISFGLGNTRSDNAYANLGNQLDGNTRTRVGALEVVDELLKIFNGVDVVVRRWGDQTDTRGGVPSVGNRTDNLVARKLSTLTGLSTLGHLDLQLIGIGQVMGSDTETARGNLLDGGPHRITILEFLATLGILTTFSSVGLAAQTVHGNSQAGVRLHGDGSIGHGTSYKTTDNLGPGLDLVDGDWSPLFKVEVEHTAKSTVLNLLMFTLGVGLV